MSFQTYITFVLCAIQKKRLWRMLVINQKHWWFCFFVRYLLYSTDDSKSHRFETTWRWENDDRNFWDMVTIHFYCVGKSSLDILLSISFCVLPMKEHHTGIEDMRMGKLWHFQVLLLNMPLFRSTSNHEVLGITGSVVLHKPLHC